MTGFGCFFGGDIAEGMGSVRSQKLGARMSIIGRDKMKYARDFFQMLLATLREIFDENAYERFLLRTGTVASVGSYREFQREREAAMARRVKCC
jgi:hypothetical protein